MNDTWQNDAAALGLYTSFLTKQFFGTMMQKMAHLGIERYYTALVAIEQSGETFTQQQLSDYFHINKASTVRIIDHLTKEGWLQRKVNEQDRRAYLLTLTDKARQVLPEIKRAFREMHELAFTGFTPTQQAEFWQAMEKIHGNLSPLPAKEMQLDLKRVRKKRKTTRQPSIIDS